MPSITRIHDSGNQGDEVDLVDLVRVNSGHVVTPVRNTATHRLSLISWQIATDGTITRLGDSGDQAGDADLCASIAVANNRMVTAVRGVQSGRLKLISWQVSSDGTTISRIADSGTLAGACDRIDLKRWAGDAETQPPVTLITAVRSTNSQRLKLIAWRLFNTGEFARLGDSGQQVGEVELISAQTAFGHNFLVTAAKGSGSQRLKVIGWRVTSSNAAMSFDRLADTGTQAGNVDRLDSCLVDLQVGPQNVETTLFTAVRGAQSQRLKLIGWLVNHQSGEITRRADSGDLAGRIGRVSVVSSPAPDIVTAVEGETSGRLKLIWWTTGGNHPEEPTGQLKFFRLADSGDQAGSIDRLARVLILARQTVRPVLTAVRGSQSKRLKLILWHLSPD